MNKEQYFISVGEPWDFESPDGQNIVGGHILCIKSNRCIVFRTNHCLKFDRFEGDILILSPRDRGIDFSDLPNKCVIVNGGLLIKHDDEDLDEKQLIANAQFVMIGTIIPSRFGTLKNCPPFSGLNR